MQDGIELDPGRYSGDIRTWPTISPGRNLSDANHKLCKYGRYHKLCTVQEPPSYALIHFHKALSSQAGWICTSRIGIDLSTVTMTVDGAL